MPEPAAADTPIPKSAPTVRVLHRKGKHRGLVLGIATDGDRIVAVGGQGRDLLLVSDDAGSTWRAADSGGNGLRGACVRGDEIWVCGEWGHVACSTNFGETWRKVPVKAGSCLFGIVWDDRGHLWTAGDAGYVGRSRDGVKFSRVSGIKEWIGRISNSSLGVLVPTDSPGHLFVRDGKTWRKTAAESGADLMAGRVTPRGTLVVVGGGGAVLRSTDRGERFERIKVGSKGLLAGIEWLDDGRLFVVGDGGKIFASYDDGRTLKKLAQSHTHGQLWCAARHGASVLVGGEDGIVLSIAD